MSIVKEKSQVINMLENNPTFTVNNQKVKVSRLGECSYSTIKVYFEKILAGVFSTETGNKFKLVPQLNGKFINTSQSFRSELCFTVQEIATEKTFIFITTTTSKGITLVRNNANILGPKEVLVISENNLVIDLSPKYVSKVVEFITSQFDYINKVDAELALVEKNKQRLYEVLGPIEEVVKKILGDTATVNTSVQDVEILKIVDSTRTEVFDLTFDIKSSALMLSTVQLADSCSYTIQNIYSSTVKSNLDTFLEQVEYLKKIQEIASQINMFLTPVA